MPTTSGRYSCFINENDKRAVATQISATASFYQML